MQRVYLLHVEPATAPCFIVCFIFLCMHIPLAMHTAHLVSVAVSGIHSRRGGAQWSHCPSACIYRLDVIDVIDLSLLG